MAQSCIKRHISLTDLGKFNIFSKKLYKTLKLSRVFFKNSIIAHSFIFLAFSTYPAKAKDSHSSNGLTLYSASRVFDGEKIHENASVLIKNNKIISIGSQNDYKNQKLNRYNLGDATILPGFIELHAHILLTNVATDKVLKHGVTTARDVGGPLKPISGGDGHLRLLTAGPILTTQKGYPISVFGKGFVAEAVGSDEEAKTVVRKLVAGGASSIKIALEPGGEPGAPWSNAHEGASSPPWPMMSKNIVKSIVNEAHDLGKIVTAHISDNFGAEVSIETGVDEWAHIPCLEIDETILRQAVDHKIRIVTTLDTMSHCPGVFSNGKKLAKLGATFLYGAEIAHVDIPWGIDAQELRLMHHITGMSAIDVLKSATSEAGKEIGIPLLGRLTADAPADIIAVKGNPIQNFKLLEYPDLVISGGKIVVNNF
jgi:imidazolonepropionase-like amidohydrolase